MTTVIAEGRTTDTSAAAGPDLWLAEDEVTLATGWTLKPEGFCKGDICVPIPAGRSADFIDSGKVNVSAFWSLLGNPVASSAAGDIWSLGEGADHRNDALLSLEAPDFTLPDFEGKPHRLSDYRRQRILLITWASW